MSRQAVAKALQRYEDKPVHPMCSNCVFFSSTTLERTEFGSTWTQEKNLRCVKGGFAVKKMGTCQDHRFKVGA